ncbi:hypothetical protein D8S78_15915 [Natrialba swarupiae]|nr:hypothetical protein [Natrialba swarupiae]
MHRERVSAVGDGWTGVLEYVRDTHPDLPFILFTAAGSETVASEAIASGVSEYVQKGGDEQFDLLAARIDDAIDRYHSRTGYRDLFEAIGDAIIVHDPRPGTSSTSIERSVSTGVLPRASV